MSAVSVLAIALPALALLGLVVLFVTTRRRDTDRATGRLSRETRRRDQVRLPSLPPEPVAVVTTGRDVERAAVAERRGRDIVPVTPGAVTPWSPPDADSLGVTRRQFLNRSVVQLMLVSITGFGAASLAFLWPKLGGGFGSKIAIGKVEDVVASIRDAKNFYYVPAGRAWITPYPADALPKARKTYAGPVVAGMEAGIVALYQKCPHLGCRVPNCDSSQWFECPCHGSQYNRVGEKKGGPAPRGMDRFAVSVANDVITVDTGQIFLGPAIGTNTTGQEAEGPHCINFAGGHG